MLRPISGLPAAGGPMDVRVDPSATTARPKAGSSPAFGVPAPGLEASIGLAASSQVHRIVEHRARGGGERAAEGLELLRDRREGLGRLAQLPGYGESFAEQPDAQG